MNETKNDRCDCRDCPGTGCPCGCQASASIAAGACACGSACRCSPAETGCLCG